MVLRDEVVPLQQRSFPDVVVRWATAIFIPRREYGRFAERNSSRSHASTNSYHVCRSVILPSGILNSGVSPFMVNHEFCTVFVCLYKLFYLRRRRLFGYSQNGAFGVLFVGSGLRTVETQERNTRTGSLKKSVPGSGPYVRRLDGCI